MREKISHIVKEFLAYSAGFLVILSALWNIGTFFNKWFQQTKMSSISVGILQAADTKICEKISVVEDRTDKVESRIDKMETQVENIDNNVKLLVKTAMNK